MPVCASGPATSLKVGLLARVRPCTKAELARTVRFNSNVGYDGNIAPVTSRVSQDSLPIHFLLQLYPSVRVPDLRGRTVAIL